MKLLIITQKIDKNDTVLGFFHGWVRELAKKYEQITVICLGVGEYDLPSNVKVFSLGKEKKASRFAYVLNFYKYIWNERKNYGKVLVHMNQEYVLLGGVFWRLIGKKVFLWRNHPKGNFLTRCAVFLSNKVFCTSTYSFTAKFKKTKIMPVGIDMNTYSRDEQMARKPNSVLFFGRISPIKRPDVFIEACRILQETSGKDFFAAIVGEPLPIHVPYFNEIRKSAEKLTSLGMLAFEQAIPSKEAPLLYNKYEVYVNSTPSGSFDKTILEAMACEVMVCTSNKSLRELVDERFVFKEGDAKDLADKLQKILELPEFEKKKIGKEFRSVVEKSHSLDLLIQKLYSEII